RTNDPNSATCQFFINTADNGFLDRTDRSAGYAVFGRVVKGLDVVDKIGKTKTTSQPHPQVPGVLMQDVPAAPIAIKSAKVIE
ncbi:MAG: peptidylprolyl isomerase, partial [Rubripirellula sp.]